MIKRAKMPPKAKRSCACGLAENSDHLKPPPCQGCPVCETNYDHKPLEEHEPVPIFNRTTGRTDHIACLNCGEWLSHA